MEGRSATLHYIRYTFPADVRTKEVIAVEVNSDDKTIPKPYQA
jgi:hypothetical protein